MTSKSIQRRIAIRMSALWCVLLAFTTSQACTTFVLKGPDHVYFGRGFAWYSEDALVIVNPRNVQKTSLTLPGTSPARWSSKYGSVTFNSGGWELPTGGMNEAGLVVEDMWLDVTKCPTPDSRPAVNSLQWIQYQLDNCRTVDEVIATEERIRVDPAGFPIPVHYLVCDATGETATIEFLEGKMVVHRGESLTCRALANEPYEVAAAQAKTHPLPPGVVKPLKGDPLFERFKRASARAAAFSPSTPREDLEYAWETLEQVNQGSAMMWRMVYDVTERQIHYRTRSHPEERVLDLKKLDFICRGPVKYFELKSRSEIAGKTRFEELTEAKHRRYVERYMTRAWVKRSLGDMTPALEALLLNLRSYRGAEAATGKEIVLVPEAARSASAEEILRKALDARGGKEAAARIQSYHATGTLKVPWQSDAPFEIFATRPDKYRFTAELKPVAKHKGGHYDQGTDGQMAWEAQPGESCKRLDGAWAEDRRRDAQFFAEIDDPKDCQSAMHLGETSFNGKKCHVLRLVKKSGEVTTHFYDAKTFRLAGGLQAGMIQNTPAWTKSSFGGYQTFDGFQFATRGSYSSQYSSAAVRIRSITLNRVDDSVFKMPTEIQARSGESKQ